MILTAVDAKTGGTLKVDPSDYPPGSLPPDEYFDRKAHRYHTVKWMWQPQFACHHCRFKLWMVPPRKTVEHFAQHVRSAGHERNVARLAADGS
jgi:hypothetical protein